MTPSLCIQRSYNEDMPNLVPILTKHIIIKRYMVWCGSKNKYQKDTCPKERITWSKYDHHSNLNNQHN